jgi:hypothetical protein
MRQTSKVNAFAQVIDRTLTDVEMRRAIRWQIAGGASLTRRRHRERRHSCWRGAPPAESDQGRAGRAAAAMNSVRRLSAPAVHHARRRADQQVGAELQ